MPQGRIVDSSLVSTRINRCFLAELLSSWWAPCWHVELFLPKCKAFLFPFVDVNEFAACTFFQPVWVPLYGSTTLQSISHLPWLFMGCELAETALSPSSSSFKKTLSSSDPWGKTLVTGPQLGVEPRASAGYQAIPTYPGCSSSVCPWGCLRECQKPC